MELPEWTGRARRVERPVLEVGFTVWDDFYYGPENDFSDEQWKTLREPLYPPRVDMRGDGEVSRVFTSALAGSVDELARHYQDVLRLTAKHGGRLNRSHFWLSPVLLLPDAEIPFAWHDTAEDAEQVMKALESPADGEIFNDADQGWEVIIVADGDRLFIRHADFDTQEEHACIWCGRDELVRQVAPLRARLASILSQLRQAVGGDYWSKNE